MKARVMVIVVETTVLIVNCRKKRAVNPLKKSLSINFFYEFNQNGLYRNIFYVILLSFKVRYKIKILKRLDHHCVDPVIKLRYVGIEDIVAQITNFMLDQAGRDNANQSPVAVDFENQAAARITF
jgi:hypothetical protein